MCGGVAPQKGGVGIIYRGDPKKIENEVHFCVGTDIQKPYICCTQQVAHLPFDEGRRDREGKTGALFGIEDAPGCILQGSLLLTAVLLSLSEVAIAVPNLGLGL